MPTPFSREVRHLPPGRFLHTASLRDEVITKLRQAAPLAANLTDLPVLDPRVPLTSSSFFRQAEFPMARLPPGRCGVGTTAIIRDFKDSQLDGTDSFGLESIIKEMARPSFLVLEDKTDFTLRSELPVEEVTYWQPRIAPKADMLKQIYQAVGRIELHNHESLNWCGTGWLLRPDVLVTNRHVAVNFAEASAGKWIFRRNVIDRQISANIDYTEEANERAEDPHRIKEIIFIQESGPDMAFLRVEPDRPRGPQNAGIPLAPVSALQIGREVLAVGYPRYDSAMPEPPDMVTRVFGHQFNVKRAAPGVIMATHLDKYYVNHDCSTLGGNSGSVVLDLESGFALGLHMGGNYQSENFAVSSDFLQQKLKALNLI